MENQNRLGIQQIHAGFDQLRVEENDLDALLHLLAHPCLALVTGGLAGQHGGVQAVVLHNLGQAVGLGMFFRERGVDPDLAAPGRARLAILQNLGFFRIQAVFGQRRERPGFPVVGNQRAPTVHPAT